MQITSGIESIIDLYNFITTKLRRDKLNLRSLDGNIECTQDGNWVILPESLHEVMIVPEGFKSGYVRKDDLIKLYDSLYFITSKKGRIEDSYMESYISPDVFGFKVWSRYPYDGTPGIKLVQEFKFKVRNRFGLIIK